MKIARSTLYEVDELIDDIESWDPLGTEIAYDDEGFYGSTGGDGEAVNKPETRDVMAVLLRDIVDTITQCCRVSMEDALACVIAAVDDMVDAGLLTPIPEMGDRRALSVWMHRAVQAGLADRAIDACIARGGSR